MPLIITEVYRICLVFFTCCIDISLKLKLAETGTSII